ncbi:hypothetical protein INR49_024447, partial [Caranx melampygus]
MAAHRCQGGGVYSVSHIVPQLALEARPRRKQWCESVVDIKSSALKQSTMEAVRSAFHAQLATVMDSLLAAAVCEIAKIFESSLCEQQAELVQKTEEISILRGKLEKVDRRQKAKSGGSEEMEMSSGDREGSLRQQTLTGSACWITAYDWSGRCSPRPDPNLAQPGEWLPGLDATRGGVSGLENLQADGTGCSGPASSSTAAEGPCFRPGFGSDETSNEDDESSFPFLDQEPENQNSSQNSVQGQGVGQRGARQDQPQAPSGESLWRPRDDR